MFKGVLKYQRVASEFRSNRALLINIGIINQQTREKVRPVLFYLIITRFDNVLGGYIHS